jgi:metal-responsive CopG/Arc/MetJ family transcriptional regulator
MLVAVTIPESLMGSLDALAAEREWNRSEAITEAVRRLVKAKRKA